MEKNEAYGLVKDHMHRYVLITMRSGEQADGIVEGLDDDQFYLAVPNWGEGTAAGPQTRFSPYGYPPYGYPPYGYPPYGYPFYPYRRFRRRIFPLAGLLALSLLPYY